MPRTINVPTASATLAKCAIINTNFLRANSQSLRRTGGKFFELYDAMENELMVLDTETRQLERDMRRDTTAGDMQLESALTAIYSQKLKEGEIEMRYARELKRVLTPRQLLQLKDAERRFNRTLMRQHRRMRSANNSSPRR